MGRHPVNERYKVSIEQLSEAFNDSGEFNEEGTADSVSSIVAEEPTLAEEEPTSDVEDVEEPSVTEETSTTPTEETVAVEPPSTVEEPTGWEAFGDKVVEEPIKEKATGWEAFEDKSEVVGEPVKDGKTKKISNYYKTLSEIESASDPKAISPTLAAGVAQFTVRSGRKYGLKVDDRIKALAVRAENASKARRKELQKEYWKLIEAGAVDERLDPVKSKEAQHKMVVDYKKDLESKIGKKNVKPWMVYGSYNQGVGGIVRIMKTARGQSSLTGQIRKNMKNNPLFDVASTSSDKVRAKKFVDKMVSVWNSKGGEGAFGVDGIGYNGYGEAGKGVSTQPTEQPKKQGLTYADIVMPPTRDIDGGSDSFGDMATTFGQSVYEGVKAVPRSIVEGTTNLLEVPSGISASKLEKKTKEKKEIYESLEGLEDYTEDNRTLSETLDAIGFKNKGIFKGASLDIGKDGVSIGENNMPSYFDKDPKDWTREERSEYKKLYTELKTTSELQDTQSKKNREFIQYLDKEADGVLGGALKRKEINKLKGGVANFLLGVLPEGAVSIATNIAINKGAGAEAAVAYMFNQASTGVMEDLQDSGVKPEEAVGWALFGGAISTALEKSGLDDLSGQGFMSEKLAKSGLGSVAIAGLGEGTTEGLQTVTEEFVKIIAKGRANGDSNDEIFNTLLSESGRIAKDAGISSLAGTILGGGAKGVSNFAESLSSDADEQSDLPDVEEVQKRTKFEKAQEQVAVDYNKDNGEVLINGASFTVESVDDNGVVTMASESGEKYTVQESELTKEGQTEEGISEAVTLVKPYKNQKKIDDVDRKLNNKELMDTLSEEEQNKLKATKESLEEERAFLESDSGAEFDRVNAIRKENGYKALTRKQYEEQNTPKEVAEESAEVTEEAPVDAEVVEEVVKETPVEPTKEEVDAIPAVEEVKASPKEFMNNQFVEYKGKEGNTYLDKGELVFSPFDGSQESILSSEEISNATILEEVKLEKQEGSESKVGEQVLYDTGESSLVVDGNNYTNAVIGQEGVLAVDSKGNKIVFKDPSIVSEVNKQVELYEEIMTQPKDKRQSRLYLKPDNGNINPKKVFNSVRSELPSLNKTSFVVEELPSGVGGYVDINKADGSAVIHIDSRLDDQSMIATVLEESFHPGIMQVLEEFEDIRGKLTTSYKSSGDTQLVKDIESAYADQPLKVRVEEFAAKSLAIIKSKGINKDGSKNAKFFDWDIKNNDGMFTKIYKTFKQWLHKVLSRFKGVNQQWKEEVIAEVWQRMKALPAKGPREYQTKDNKVRRLSKVQPKDKKYTATQLHRATELDKAKRMLRHNLVILADKKDYSDRIDALKSLGDKYYDVVEEMRGRPAPTDVKKAKKRADKALSDLRDVVNNLPYKDAIPELVELTKTDLSNIDSIEELGYIEDKLKRASVKGKRSQTAQARANRERIENASEDAKKFLALISREMPHINDGVKSIEKAALAVSKLKSRFKALAGINKTSTQSIVGTFNKRDGIWYDSKGNTAPITINEYLNKVAKGQSQVKINKVYSRDHSTDIWYDQKGKPAPESINEHLRVTSVNARDNNIANTITRNFKKFFITNQLNTRYADKDLDLEGTEFAKILSLDTTKGERHAIAERKVLQDFFDDSVMEMGRTHYKNTKGLTGKALVKAQKKAGVKQMERYSADLGTKTAKVKVPMMVNGKPTMVELSPFEIGTIHLQSRNADARKHFLNNGVSLKIKDGGFRDFNMTEKTLDKIDAFIANHPDILNIAEKMWTNLNSNDDSSTKSKLNVVSQKTDQHNIAGEDDYFGIKTRHSVEVEEAEGKNLAFGDKLLHGTPSPKNRGQWKKRELSHKDPIIIEDMLTAYINHQSNASEYIGKYEAYVNARKTLDMSKDWFVENDMEAYYDVYNSAIEAYGGARQDSDWMDKLMANYAVGVLAVSPTAVPKQPLSGISLYRQYPARVATKALSTEFKVDKAEWEDVLDNVPFLWERSQIIPDTASLTASINKKTKQAVTGSPGWGQWMMRNTIGAFDEIAMKRFYRAADITARDKGLTKGSDEYWDSVNESIESDVILTQPDSSEMGKTHAQRQKGASRILNMFFSVRTKLWQQMREDVRDVARGIKTGNKELVANGVRKLIVSHLGNIGSMALLVQMIDKMMGKDEEDRKLGSYMKASAINHLLGNIAYAGPILSGVMLRANNEFSFPVEHPVLDIMNDLTVLTGNQLAGKKVTGKQKLKIANRLAAITGMPAGNIIKLLIRLNEVAK